MPFAWDKEKHLDMMRSTERWPQWPYLPLKRVSGDVGRFETGVLIDALLAPGLSEAMGRTVFFTNCFSPDIKGCDREEYETLDAIVDDGWVID